MANKTLTDGKNNKKDEFYTQIADIENELKNYKKHFKDKVVFCNCDDPYESNFFKYFTMNFNQLGLKKLIATGYATSPIIAKEVNVWTGEETEVPVRTPYVAYINEVRDLNGDGRIDLEDVKILLKEKRNCRRKLKGETIYKDGKKIVYPAGDFRSSESIKLLMQSDIVVTNPPFSLFREYVAQLIKYNKKFVILGNPNSLTYKDIFPLIKSNQLWIGNKSMGTDMLFDVPERYAKELVETKKEGSGYKIVNGVVKGRTQAIWFTNLDVQKRHENLDLYKEYSPEEYPKYDDYDAINVNKICDIPCDYDGIMGVPITFLDKFNPDQFEIIGLDRYVDDNPHYGHRFKICNKETYARILIRKRKSDGSGK